MWVMSVLRAQTAGGRSPAAGVVGEVEEVELIVVVVALAPAHALAFQLELPVDDHEAKVRDIVTTSAALHGSRL